MSTWKEPGLFNNYQDAKLESGVEVCLETSGNVEFCKTGGYYGDEVYMDVTLEELELLARAARALKEYDAAETRRVEEANREA